MYMATEKLTARQFSMNILNGVAIGTVLALIPGALLGELFKALLGVFPQGQFVLDLTTLSNSMLGLIIGVVIGYQFKFTPIQSASIGLAVMVGGGAASFADGVLSLDGTGDVINMMFTGAIAAGLVLLLGERLKSYSIIFIPPILLIVGGRLVYALLPLVANVTTVIGAFVEQLLTLQPIIMGILIAVLFYIFIIMPITSLRIFFVVYIFVFFYVIL